MGELPLSMVFDDTHDSEAQLSADSAPFTVEASDKAGAVVYRVGFQDVGDALEHLRDLVEVMQLNGFTTFRCFTLRIN